MTSNVVYLITEQEYLGNGALEVIAEYFSHIYPARLMERLKGETELSDEDHFLTWLACEGFVIAPLDDELDA